MSCGFIEKPVVNISGKTTKSTSSGNDPINSVTFSKLAALSSQRVSNCNRAIFILFIYNNKIKTQIKNSEHNYRFFFKLFILTSYLIEAAKYSLFKRAMFSKEIPLGHSTSQAPVLVQLPNPTCSSASTMFN